jgi:3-phenylpropionate/cinnamic acid dioxygenase small subunit
MTDLEEISKVQNVVARIAHHIDAKQWAALRTLYADDVETDYTSLFGGEVKREHAESLVGTWQKMLGKLQTQHLLGPIVVVIEGQSARAECHVRATHLAHGLRGGDEWVASGHYVVDLVRRGETWLIGKMKLETLLQQGNAQLLEQAAG